jgi:phytoene dehydrogenase-like protein
MTTKHLVIIGGGLAGLSAGCYALASGFRVTVVEHNLALGGVCTAWPRGGYLIDGCIQWLTGGPFDALYRELGVLPALQRRPLREFVTWRDGPGPGVSICADARQLRENLVALAPADADEIDRLLGAAAEFASLDPGVDRAPELASLRDRLRGLGELAPHLGALVHFRGSVGEWSTKRLRSERLRRLISRVLPGDAPAFFLLMVLGYLARGWLSRPVGGSGAFRDLLAARFRALGGEALLRTTVDEIVVRGDRACGVRLEDGTAVEADEVLSTASSPETVFRLLGGRYGAGELRERLARWPLFDPIVIASFGVERAFAEQPSTLLLDGFAPFHAGGAWNDFLHVRIFNEGPEFAPPGHTVVQTILRADFDWWATRGERYVHEKDVVAATALAQLEPHLPGLTAAARLRDVATPLTFWRGARSWRGAFEGWRSAPEGATAHVAKTLPGLGGLHLAGQWVEPGGGVPTAVMSGRQAVQLLCAEAKLPFAAPAPVAG